MTDVIAWLNKFEWAIEPRIGRAIFQKLAMQKLTPEMIAQFEALSIGSPKPSQEKPYTVHGDVAVIRMAGTLVKRRSMSSALFGEIGTVDIGNAIKQANEDRDVRSILMEIDSPGGTVDGTAELAEIFGDSGKPLVSWIDGLCASAAYWAASQSAAVIAKPTSLVGSIGTLLVHHDYSVQLEQEGIKVTPLVADTSPDKALGSSHEPLSDDARAYYIDILNTLNAQFQAGVRLGRADKITDESTAFSGRVFVAEKSPDGLIDSIGSFDAALEEARKLGANSRSFAMSWLTPKLSSKMAENTNTEVIAFVRMAFQGSDFKSTAIEMAFDGKSAAEIVAASHAHLTKATADLETRAEKAEALVKAYSEGLAAAGVKVEGEVTADSVKAAVTAPVTEAKKELAEANAKLEAGGVDTKTGGDLLAQYEALTDPVERSKFRQENGDALLALARKNNSK